MTKQQQTGFGPLPCPCCGEPQATIDVELNSLKTFRCSDCCEDFDWDAVLEMVSAARRWERVLAWICTAPGERD